MDIYTKCIWPHFANSDEDALFVTSDGVAFKEGTIGRRLASFIKKCGVHLGSRMAFVDMWKVVTTEMLKRATKEEQQILWRVLAHSEKTSRKWYSHPDLTDTGIKNHRAPFGPRREIQVCQQVCVSEGRGRTPNFGQGFVHPFSISAAGRCWPIFLQRTCLPTGFATRLTPCCSCHRTRPTP